MDVFNPVGERVAILVDGVREAGNYMVLWEAEGVASGVYHCRLRAGSFMAVNKLNLIR